MKCAQSAHVKNAGRVLWPFLIQFVIVQWVIPHKYPFHSTIPPAQRPLRPTPFAKPNLFALWSVLNCEEPPVVMHVCMCPAWCPCVLRPASCVLLPVGVPVIRSIKLKRLLMCKPQTRPRPRPSLRLCLSTWQCRSGFPSYPIPCRPTRCPLRCPDAALATFSQLVWQPKPKVPVFHRAQSTFSCSLKCKLDGNEVYILANKALDLHEKLRKFWFFNHIMIEIIWNF